MGHQGSPALHSFLRARHYIAAFAVCSCCERRTSARLPRIITHERSDSDKLDLDFSRETSNRLVMERTTWVRTVPLAMAVACGAPDQAERAGKASGKEEAGHVIQSLESYWDRQPAAAVTVIRHPTTFPDNSQLWVFACSSSGQLMRRVKTDFRTNSFQDDWTVEASAPCASVPSAGAWSRSPQDQVEVVYRSTSNQLIEVFYDETGNREELNLSDYLNFGEIAGAPVIADMDDEEGNLSVVVRNASNHLYTLSVFANAWHTYPVVSPWGTGPMQADGTLVGWYSNTKGFLSASFQNVYRTYRHPAWNTGFKEFNAPVPSNLTQGVVTFAPRGTQVIAVARDSTTGKLYYSDTSTAWNFIPVPATPSQTGNTVYLGAPYSYFYGNDNLNGTIAFCREATAFGGNFELTAFEQQHIGNPKEILFGSSTVNSANAMVANPAGLYSTEVFYADQGSNLMWYSYRYGLSPMDLTVRF